MVILLNRHKGGNKERYFFPSSESPEVHVACVTIATSMVAASYCLSHCTVRPHMDLGANTVLTLFSSDPWRGWRTLPKEVLWQGTPVRGAATDGSGRVCVPGEMPPHVCARVRLRRQVLWEPLRSVPRLLSSEEKNICHSQQGLFLQR